VRRLVLDAGAVLSWFDADGPALEDRAEYEAGTLRVFGPRHLLADVLDRVARSGEWAADELARIGSELERLGFELMDPPTALTAAWLTRGLDARRAAYVALAEHLEARLVTDDETLRADASSLILR
jgi:predicted nucleic acid-binding protein